MSFDYDWSIRLLSDNKPIIIDFTYVSDVYGQSTLSNNNNCIIFRVINILKLQMIIEHASVFVKISFYFMKFLLTQIRVLSSIIAKYFLFIY